MNSELKKSLVDLIDETLNELEELKKSRFSAAEIKLEGPGADGIAGKPSNGSMGKEEDKKEDDKEDEDKEMDKAEGTNEEAEKAEGTNEEAEKSEHDSSDEEDEDDKKKKSMSKKEDEDEEDEEDEEHEKKMEEKMKKSQEEVTSLMKSFVDERIKPLEDKLSTIVDLVNKLADQPVAPKGFTARGAVPLMKSAEEGSYETLSKAQVTSKLLELKKSGTQVETLDITKAEMGQDIEQIVKKYKIS